jgi:hypothetical protein
VAFGARRCAIGGEHHDFNALRGASAPLFGTMEIFEAGAIKTERPRSMCSLKKSIALCATSTAIAMLSATSSLAQSERCVPVEIEKTGYVQDDNGEYVVVPGTNMTEYQVVMKRCKKGSGSWSSRSYYGYADSITFDSHKYWCVRFFAAGKRYRIIKYVKKEDCY